MLKKFFGEVKSLDMRGKLLLALIFVLPFERIPSVEAGGLTLKLSLLVGIAFISIGLKDTLSSLKGMDHFMRLPRVFLEYSILSVIWVENMGYWLKANLVLGFCIVLFYTVIALLTDSERRERLVNLVLKTILLSAGVVMVFGLFQWLGNLIGIPDGLTAIRPEYTADKLGLPRMHSVLLEPLYFGLYLLLPLGILWADCAGVTIKNLYARFGLIALIYLSILLSLARGAIVASILIGLIGLVYSYKELKRQLKVRDLSRLLVGGVVALALLVGATSILGKQGTDEDHLYERGFSTIIGHLETIKPWGDNEDAKDQNSINSRDEARSEGWKIVTASKDNFVFGVGAGQYGPNINPTLSPPKGLEATSNFMLLDVWVEYGLVGLTLLITFLTWVLFGILRARNAKTGLSDSERVLVIGAGLYLVGLLVQSITFGELAITHLWVMLALLSASIISITED